MEKRPEIMAPVGGQEQLLAAVRCGADAVYLGGKGFNARRNAANFGETDLSEAVAYCHERGVKVYVTINTIVMDSERGRLEEEADYIASSGADAVIIQDLSVLKLFEHRYPDLTRFASTQTAVHNVDSAKFLRDQGFQSIVLARELSLVEIERISSAVDLPMEAFIHGAHCMSVSGACYLSAIFGGRSGNRGLCAQPCRLDWVSGERHSALSLKDMSLLPHIRRMAEAGVDILKIEGRMKRPEYVAAAVTATKNAIEGRPYDVETLKAVFSRSGFTDGYLTGRRDAAMFGARTKEDVVGAERVLKDLSALYQNELPRVGLTLDFSLDETGSRLTVGDGAHSVSIAGRVPEKALNRPLDAESAEKNLTKFGGTPYYTERFSAAIAPGLMLRASDLNALRREAVEALSAERRANHAPAPLPYRIDPPVPYRAASRKPALWARFYRADQLSALPEDVDLDRILLPVEKIDAALIERFGQKLTAQLPTVLFPADEPAMEARLVRLKEVGLASVYANNCYGVHLARRLGLAAHGGFGLNVINTEALKAYEKAGLNTLTVSFELAMNQIVKLGGTLPRGIVSYGALPLMHFRNCPVRANLGCTACGQKGSITDRMGVEFPVECWEYQFSTLLNSVPLDVAERVPKELDFALLYFTRETPKEIAAVLRRFAAGQKTDAPHTAGLYYRELL